MTPNNNNYFVIIIRIFFCQPCFLSENTDFFRLLLSGILFASHRIHDFTNYLHNIDMYLFCMGAIHRGYL